MVKYIFRSLFSSTRSLLEPYCLVFFIISLTLCCLGLDGFSGSNSGLSANSHHSDGSFNSAKSNSSQKQQGTIFVKGLTKRNVNLKGRKHSKTTSQGPSYNIQINEDVYLLERIGPSINYISPNHNPFCPLCLKCNPSHHIHPSQRINITSAGCSYWLEEEQLAKCFGLLFEEHKKTLFNSFWLSPELCKKYSLDNPFSCGNFRV